MAYRYDVVVVGAGHAGCEAALAAARMGCRTALLTQNLDTVAQMSCNPAIGGIAKGHLVREIDALGGEMARNTDRAGIQYRFLNTRKGPAVRALRAQADRLRYRLAMRRVLEAQPGLDLVQATVEAVLVSGDAVEGVRTSLGEVYLAPAVVLTTGTFLRGLIHVGMRRHPGGRAGEPAVEGLSKCLMELGFSMGRLKTGTPPRLDGRSINWSVLAVQPGDDPPQPFSLFTERVTLPQLPCHVTATNPETHRIIRENLDRSPLYSGVIHGIGPRYCPSIEDKVVKFPERDSHVVFLEPEGLDTTEIYPNGISTSLPADVQVRLVQSIRGLEKARILRPGYAIEYDFVHPTQLRHTLETKRIAGLFHAGQINGTTGYEEAAGQGLVAGINAAQRALGRPPFVPQRWESYLGVMIDDLVTKGTDEPYRLFTSRAEYRLLLRHDNADLRLMETGFRLGLIPEEAYQRLLRKRERIQEELQRLRKTRVKEVPGLEARVSGDPLSPDLTLEQLLRRPNVDYATLAAASPPPWGMDPDVGLQVEVQVKYEGYIRRQHMEVERQQRMEDRAIPPTLDYERLPGLSTEVRQKLQAVRPVSLGQASRIPGITPAAMAILAVAVARENPSGASP